MTTAVLTKTQLELLKRKDKRNFEHLKERLIVF